METAERLGYRLARELLQYFNGDVNDDFEVTLHRIAWRKAEAVAVGVGRAKTQTRRDSIKPYSNQGELSFAPWSASRSTHHFDIYLLLS